MKDIFLVNYSVKGIKSLKELVSLSFYNKTISKMMDTQKYSVKGIYGMNGSGKSAIIASIDILRSILLYSDYLTNDLVQRNLNEMINKNSEELFMEADFVTNYEEKVLYFRYQINVTKNKVGKYIIAYEKLATKKASSKTNDMETIFEVNHGDLQTIYSKNSNGLSDLVAQKTLNLLTNSSLPALFMNNVYDLNLDDSLLKDNPLFRAIGSLVLFGSKLHVYFDQSDVHGDYFLTNSFQYMESIDFKDAEYARLINRFLKMNDDTLNVIKISKNYVLEKNYAQFVNAIEKMCEFIRIFKTDLVCIDIDKKVNNDLFICNLVMNYGDYRVHAEFESTGIKKLIKLYAYVHEMAHGDIVFIDELDSNLHDVYLCALLEYLMEYGKGQLCFTTHNVGPMEVLKRHKKSIDFLSTNGKVTSWVKNGNYSPSHLYRNGMIDGSPFNVDSIDFIPIFGIVEED